MGSSHSNQIHHNTQEIQRALLAKDPDVIKLMKILKTRLLKSIGLGVCIGAFIYFLFFMESNEAEELKEFSDTECIVCQSHQCEVIILPCLHFILCKSCSMRITDECPVCRIEIHKILSILDFVDDAPFLFND